MFYAKGIDINIVKLNETIMIIITNLENETFIQ